MRKQNLNYRDYYPEESIEYLNREAIPQIRHGKAWTGTCVAFGATGSRLHLQHKSGAIFGDAGNVTYTFAIMNDVSDKVRYQEDIEAKTVELDCKSVRLKEEIENHKETIAKLEVTMKEIKTLRGIILICMHCKGIRDDKGYWNRIEKYISEHSETQFSHSICEECLEKHYPDETE